MELSKKNLLEPMSEIDSNLEVGLNWTELSPINLHDSVGFWGTVLCDNFSSQLLYFDGENNSFYGDNNSTTDQSTSTNAYQFEYPENECYLLNEPMSPMDSILDEVINTSAKQSKLSNIENNDNAGTKIVGQQELTYNAAIDDEKVYPKPPCPFTYLVTLALKNSWTGALNVNGIYRFISEHFPYYRTAPKSWKNSVRHNLSFNSIFVKITTPTTNNTTNRNNLWTIDPTKIHAIDQKVLKSSRKKSLRIKQAMLHPEHLELLERGEMKFDAGDEISRDDFDVNMQDAKLECESECNEYQSVPVAKRRKTSTGLPPVEYLYEVVTRRKTPLVKEAVMEPSIENDRAIDFLSHEF